MLNEHAVHMTLMKFKYHVGSHGGVFTKLNCHDRIHYLSSSKRKDTAKADNVKNCGGLGKKEAGLMNRSEQLSSPICHR